MKRSAWRQKCKAVVLLCLSVGEKNTLPKRLRFYRCSVVLILKWRHAVRLTDHTATKETIYTVYIYIKIYKYWFVEWDSVVGPSSISICWEKCQISLKSVFYQILHISEPNTALVNVGGQRFTRAGKDHGISKMDGSIFLFCFCFSFFFLMQSSV